MSKITLGLTKVASRPKRSRAPESHQLDLFAVGKIIELRPHASPFDMAKLYDDCGDWQAVEWYERAIACRDRALEALCHLGAFYARNFQWKNALACFRDAVTLDPFSVDAHVCLGDYFSNVGDEDMALEHYQWCVQLAPENVQVRLAVGFILARRGQTADAIAELEFCRKLTRRLGGAAEQLLARLHAVIDDA